MRKQILEILQGWGNHFKDEFNLLPKDIKNISEKRLLICNTCPLRVDNSCSSRKKGKVVKTFIYNQKIRNQGELHKGCGCNLAAKTKSLLSDCPLGKW